MLPIEIQCIIQDYKHVQALSDVLQELRSCVQKADPDSYDQLQLQQVSGRWKRRFLSEMGVSCLCRDCHWGKWVNGLIRHGDVGNWRQSNYRTNLVWEIKNCFWKQSTVVDFPRVKSSAGQAELKQVVFASGDWVTYSLFFRLS